MNMAFTNLTIENVTSTTPPLITIQSFSIKNSPPSALTLEIKGVLAETINGGASIAISAKYGCVKIIQQSYQLEDFLAQYSSSSLPLQAGTLTLSLSANVSTPMPKGKYNAFISALNSDNREILSISILFDLT